MRNVTVLKVYNLVNDKGNKLQLRLGELKSRHDDVCISSGDKGIRWSFVGTNIPMPVRSRTWFNGFPAATMLEWLKGNGWYVQTCVNMCDGKATVYALPGDNDASKGNETCAAPSEEDERVFRDTIYSLVKNGKRISAVRLYRYANCCSMQEAYYAVREICGESTLD
jgi:hypothetical protein